MQCASAEAQHGRNQGALVFNFFLLQETNKAHSRPMPSKMVLATLEWESDQFKMSQTENIVCVYGILHTPGK